MKVPYLLPYLLSLGYAWITAAERAFKRTLPMTATKPTQGIAAGYPGRDKSCGLMHPTSQSRSLQPFRQGLAEQQCSGANQHQTEVGWEVLNKSLPLPPASPLPAEDAFAFTHSVTGVFFLQLSFLLSS